MTSSLASLSVPPPLKRGDKIGIVSTARKINPKELQFALDTFSAWGLVPVLGEHIFSVENQYAGSDLIRTIDFQNMMDNPDIKAIICARGGMVLFEWSMGLILNPSSSALNGWLALAMLQSCMLTYTH